MVNLSPKKKILGISAYYHDAAAVLVVGGKIVAAAHEERFTRKKHDPAFPSRAAIFCLEEGGIHLEDLDAVVFYDKPLLKFERLIETYLAFAPRGLRSFIASVTVWIKEKLFLRQLLLKELKGLGSWNPETKLLFSEHHLSHAASAYYPSPFPDAAILTVDGVGEWATASISYGKGSSITLLKELYFPHSLGLLYSAFTYFLGFKVNSGEYKLMGLAPYGDPASPKIAEYKKIIYDHLVTLFPDGSICLNQTYFTFATGLTMVPDSKWEKLFGFPRRKSEDPLAQHHGDLALAIQQVAEEIVLVMARHAKKLTGARFLCLAGGVALNCVANSRILNEKIFDDIWIQPAAGDAGGALGAALAVSHMYFAEPRTAETSDGMSGAYLGPNFSSGAVALMIKKYRAQAQKFSNESELCKETARRLDEGEVVGWFQGRMEWGPRALGNRSILGDPRNSDMQKRLNLKIKFREGFRPFAPSVLAERASEFFETNTPSPYMLLIAPVKKDRQIPLPKDFHKGTISEKLYFKKSDLPSITHLDYSARLQTVHRETNPRYHALIAAFDALTGYPVIVNTSFNVRGEPIVCTPEDAYRCFMTTDMDTLVIEDFLFQKKNQPSWKGEKIAYEAD